MSLQTGFNGARRALAVRSRPRAARAVACEQQTALPYQLRRTYADASKDMPESPDGKGPNTDQSPHVSEEAAATAKAMGEVGPDLSQGTPVQEIVKGDKEAEKKLPKVMRDELKSSGKRQFSTSTQQRRTYTTSARRPAQLQQPSTFGGNAVIPSDAIFSSPAYASFLGNRSRRLSPAAREKAAATVAPELRLPELPLHQHRYNPVIEQLVGLMMRHGKKSVAQRNMSHILALLRTSPAPSASPSHPLVPTAPPASHLPLDPVVYLESAVDSVAPLLRIKNLRGVAGGGMSLPIPVPLTQRQRRRQAMTWIIDAASKKRGRGSGKNAFAQRVAEELIAVVEGRSSVWDKRVMIHKTGVAARANASSIRRGPRR